MSTRNQLTFSLASLVFLIALGLVFAPMSVMAHDDATSEGNTPRPHSHPLTTALAAKTTPTTATDLGTAVPIHDAHPAATIVAKPDAKNASLTTSEGRDVILLAADGTKLALATAGAAGTDGRFNVRVTFSGTLTNNGDTTDDDNEVLNTDEVTFRARTSKGGSINVSGIQPTVTNVTGEPNQFDVEIPVAAAIYWDQTATPPAHTLPIEIFIDIAKNAVSSQSYINTGGDTVSSVGSDTYKANAATKFTMVESFPEEKDTTPPTVTVAAPSTANADGTLNFTFTFSEALGTGANAFTVGDVTVMGGTVTDLTGPATGNVYTMKVTPSSATATVTVSLNSGAVADAEDPANLLTDVAMATATYDNTPPTVTIIAPTAPEADGKLTFTFVFSEPITADTFKSADIVGEDYLVTDAPTMDATDTMNKTWTAKVKSIGADDVTVVLNAGAVEDMNGNELAEGAYAKYTPPGPPTKETVPPEITISATGYMTGTRVNGLNCDVGNMLGFAAKDPTSTPTASGVKTGSMVEKSEVSVTTAGWEIVEDSGSRWSTLDRTKDRR